MMYSLAKALILAEQKQTGVPTAYYTTSQPERAGASSSPVSFANLLRRNALRRVLASGQAVSRVSPRKISRRRRYPWRRA